jgi:hypothetical protein
MWVQFTVAGDRLGGVKVESTHEHGQSAKHNLFGFGQQRV